MYTIRNIVYRYVALTPASLLGRFVTEYVVYTCKCHFPSFTQKIQESEVYEYIAMKLTARSPATYPTHGNHEWTSLSRAKYTLTAEMKRVIGYFIFGR